MGFPSRAAPSLVLRPPIKSALHRHEQTTRSKNRFIAIRSSVRHYRLHSLWPIYCQQKQHKTSLIWTTERDKTVCTCITTVTVIDHARVANTAMSRLMFIYEKQHRFLRSFCVRPTANNRTVCLLKSEPERGRQQKGFERRRALRKYYIVRKLKV